MPESYPVSARLMYVPDGVQNSLRVSCMRKLGMDLFIYLFFFTSHSETILFHSFAPRQTSGTS